MVGQGDLKAAPRQQTLGELLIDRIILDHQRFPLRRIRRGQRVWQNKGIEQTATLAAAAEHQAQSRVQIFRSHRLDEMRRHPELTQTGKMLALLLAVDQHDRPPEHFAPGGPRRQIFRQGQTARRAHLGIGKHHIERGRGRKLRRRRQEPDRHLWIVGHANLPARRTQHRLQLGDQTRMIGQQQYPLSDQHRRLR